jgi:hypothetical protein
VNEFRGKTSGALSVLPAPGIYKHFKDGRYYQVLWQATLEEEVAAADVDLQISVVLLDQFKPDAAFFVASRVTGGKWNGVVPLLVARSHSPMKKGNPVVVYVPLYADKPGRRISVRAVAEFNELVDKPCVTCAGKGWLNSAFSDPWKCPGCCGAGSVEGFEPKVPRFSYIGDVIPGAK